MGWRFIRQLTDLFDCRSVEAYELFRNEKENKRDVVSRGTKAGKEGRLYAREHGTRVDRPPAK